MRFLAYATLALTSAKCPIIASILGSVAAAIACESDGNNPIDPESLIKRLDRLEQQTLMQPVPSLRRGEPH